MTDYDRAYVLGAAQTTASTNHVAAVVKCEQSQGAYALVEDTLDRGPAPHVHEQESIYVISG